MVNILKHQKKDLFSFLLQGREQVKEQLTTGCHVAGMRSASTILSIPEGVSYQNELHKANGKLNPVKWIEAT